MLPTTELIYGRKISATDGETNQGYHRDHEQSGSPTPSGTRGREMKINPVAGKPAERSILVDLSKLITAYYSETPDPAVFAQRVAFGTSGHRGSSFATTFNEAHVLAISQAICLYRKTHHIDGPLFLGRDTHALSVPAQTTALEVLAANGVEVMIAEDDSYTPTPAISWAILTHNRGHQGKPS